MWSAIPPRGSAILDLRNDPDAASLMAAEHASDNKAALEDTLGRDADRHRPLHGAFPRAGRRDEVPRRRWQAIPTRAGAAMFPAAARANRSIFYAANGQPRTLGEIYSRFAAKLDKGAAAVGATGSRRTRSTISRAVDALGARIGDAEVVARQR